MSESPRWTWAAVWVASWGVGLGPACRAGGGKGPAHGGDTAQLPVHVTTCQVVRGTLAHTLEGIGHVEGWQSAQIRPQADGQLQAVHFREGERVARGQSLAQIDPRIAEVQQTQAIAKVDGGRAKVELSRLALKRAGELRRSNLNAQQDVDLARATLLQDEATLLDAQAQLTQARLQLEYARVLAPFDGVVGVRLLDPGNIVHAADANAALVQLVQMDPVAVMVSMPEDVLPDLQAAALAGPVAVAVVARDGTVVLGHGTLWVIDNQVQSTSGTVRLKVKLENPDRRLWPGQYVRARLQVGRREGVLMVPAEAVTAGVGAVVWAVEQGGRAAQRRVRIGAQEGGWAEVHDGLLLGEEVVIVGQHLLRPGREVVARAAGPAALPAAPAPP